MYIQPPLIITKVVMRCIRYNTHNNLINMTFFLDYINNAVIKSPIYLTSHTCIVRLMRCIEELKCLFCFFKYSYFSEKILLKIIIKTFDFCKSLSFSDPSYQTRFKMLIQQNQTKLSPLRGAIPLTRLLFHFSWDGLKKNGVQLYNNV